MPRLLDNYQAVLLDMHQTFMFDVDRFGPEQNYAASYRQLGGGELSDDEVNALVGRWFDLLMTYYESDDYLDDFPTIVSLLNQLEVLPAPEKARLEAVFALHERGRIPNNMVNTIKTLAQSHQLGVVSNIWAPSHYWDIPLKQADLYRLFKARVFSSDGPFIKPHPQLFEQALAQLGVDKKQVLFVGDSFYRDVLGATKVGLDAVWVNRDAFYNRKRPDPAIALLPDLTHLLELQAS